MWSIFSFVLHHCADEAQQYVKMFSDIERYPQLRNYYIGCHKVSMPARLAQSVEHETLNLRVVGSSPTSGAAFFFLSPFVSKNLNMFSLSVKSIPSASNFFFS